MDAKNAPPRSLTWKMMISKEAYPFPNVFFMLNFHGVQRWQPQLPTTSPTFSHREVLLDTTPDWHGLDAPDFPTLPEFPDAPNGVPSQGKERSISHRKGKGKSYSKVIFGMLLLRRVNVYNTCTIHLSQMWVNIPHV